MTRDAKVVDKHTTSTVSTAICNSRIVAILTIIMEGVNCFYVPTHDHWRLQQVIYQLN